MLAFACFATQPTLSQPNLPRAPNFVAGAYLAAAGTSTMNKCVGLCRSCVYTCHQPDMRQAIERGDTDAVIARLDRPVCLGLVNLDMANGDGNGNGASPSVPP